MIYIYIYVKLLTKFCLIDKQSILYFFLMLCKCVALHFSHAVNFCKRITAKKYKLSPPLRLPPRPLPGLPHLSQTSNFVSLCVLRMKSKMEFKNFVSQREKERERRKGSLEFQLCHATFKSRMYL